jgi:DNA-binding beta-propeller fold protein YncE
MKFNFLRFAPKVFLILLLIAFHACSSDPDPVIPQGSAGYFVVNEGGFGNSNTSISFFDRANNKMTNDIFASVNGRALGDQAQSMTVFEGKGYIAVQNSAKVEVINADDFKSVKTITEGIESPRYFLGISSSKGYISDWGGDGVTGTVKVIDLNSFAVTKTIPTGKGANRMLLKDGKVYVSNNGGYDVDVTVSIIDTSTDAVTGTITLNDNPNSLAFDKDGNLWVSGIGNYFDTNPWIAKVGTDNKVIFTKELPEITYASATIAMNKAGDKFFYNYGGSVYAMSTTATELPTTNLIEKDFYGLAVDPITDEIIGTEAINFSSAGKIYIYSSDGTLNTSYEAGIAPSGVAFK